MTNLIILKDELGLALTGNELTLELKAALVVGGSGTWGTITGTLSSQTDLQNALDDKADASALQAHESAADPHPQYLQSSDVGSAAFTSSTDYATAAQGSTADTALQPNDGLSALDSSAASKLGAIEPGAQVNVQSDWNAVSGDAFIKNKPPVTGAIWGSVTGTLADQTDLQNALDAKASASALSAHTSDTNNPHNVTKAKIDLGNVDNTADANKNVLSATKWTTSRTLTIGKTSKPVDGSTDVAWTLDEIGVVPTSVEDILVFPEPQGLIRVDWWGPEIPTENVGKQEYTGRSRIVIDGVVWEGHSKVKIQGTGSSGLPKKNLTLKFYTDDTFSIKWHVKVGNSVVFEQFVYKAEYPDASLSNNRIGYELFGEMIEARTTFPKNEVDYAWIGEVSGTTPLGMPTGAVGYTKTWPCVMFHNDAYYGVGYLIIKEDMANFNIDINNASHCHFEFDARETSNNIVGKDWQKLNPDYPLNVMVTGTLTQQRYDAISRLTTLVTGSVQNWKDTATNCFNKQNLIDCYLLIELMRPVDNLAQDWDFVSYNNQMFFVFPYDLELSFGLAPTLAPLSDPTEPLVEKNSVDPAKTFWVLIRNAWELDVNARYAYLRSCGVFSVSNIYKIARNAISMFSKELLAAEIAKWPNWHYSTAPLAAKLRWLTARLAWMDTEFNYTPHSQYVTVIDQGDNADYPRPANTKPIYWLGNTRPDNADEGDYIWTGMDDEE